VLLLLVQLLVLLLLLLLPGCLLSIGKSATLAPQKLGLHALDIAPSLDLAESCAAIRAAHSVFVRSFLG